MPMELMVEISASGGNSPEEIARKLMVLGGTMHTWQPSLNDKPAKATFTFQTAMSRQEFARAALQIDGVRLAT